MFQFRRSFGSRPLSWAISSSFWDPAVKYTLTPAIVSVSPGCGSISSISSSHDDWPFDAPPGVASFFRRRAAAAASLRLGPSCRSRKCTRSVNVACASVLLLPFGVGSSGTSISWSRSSIHASVSATLAPMVHPAASSASSPPSSKRLSLAHFTHSSEHRMKHACAGCR